MSVHTHTPVGADRPARGGKPDLLVGSRASWLPRPPDGESVHTRGRFRQARLAYPTRPDRGHDRIAQLDGDFLAGKAPADAKEVAAGGEREHRAFDQADTIRDRAHLQPIADRKALETQLASQEPGHDLRADRRGHAVDRPHNDVGAHHRARTGADRGPERLERAFVRILLDDRKVEVRIERGVAVAGEVLGARGHSGVLQAVDPACSVGGDSVGCRPERSYSDDWIYGVAVDV